MFYKCTLFLCEIVDWFYSGAQFLQRRGRHSPTKVSDFLFLNSCANQIWQILHHCFVFLWFCQSCANLSILFSNHPSTLQDISQPTKQVAWTEQQRQGIFNIILTPAINAITNLPFSMMMVIGCVQTMREMMTMMMTMMMTRCARTTTSTTRVRTLV